MSITERAGQELTIVSPAWETPENAFECRVLLQPEDCGGFSAHALNLKGIVSEGDTEEEALRNIADAFRGAIAVYAESGMDIPWGPVDIDSPGVPGSKERWIIVDV